MSLYQWLSGIVRAIVVPVAGSSETVYSDQHRVVFKQDDKVLYDGPPEQMPAELQARYRTFQQEVAKLQARTDQMFKEVFK